MDTINGYMAGDRTYDYWKSQYEALERLYKNEDFQTVILDGYFKDRAIAGTSMLSTDYTKQAGVRTDIMEGLIAISTLQDHFNTIQNLGAPTQQEQDEQDMVIPEETDKDS